MPIKHPMDVAVHYMRMMAYLLGHHYGPYFLFCIFCRKVFFAEKILVTEHKVKRNVDIVNVVCCGVH